MAEQAVDGLCPYLPAAMLFPATVMSGPVLRTHTVAEAPAVGKWMGVAPCDRSWSGRDKRLGQTRQACKSSPASERTVLRRYPAVLVCLAWPSTGSVWVWVVYSLSYGQ